ncbi:MAG: hypothetical protein WC375_11665 [Methanomassiliicoccales archaeon]|jgi:hypothetical protein
MKFQYCRNCKTLQKRSWYSFFSCRRCGAEPVVIYIKTGIIGYVAYAATFIAMFLVAAKVIEYDLGLGDLNLYLMFGLLTAAMVCMFYEIGREERLAIEKVNDPHLR